MPSHGVLPKGSLELLFPLFSGVLVSFKALGSPGNSTFHCSFYTCLVLPRRTSWSLLFDCSQALVKPNPLMGAFSAWG